MVETASSLMTDYEQKRQEKIAANRAVLASLGIVTPPASVSRPSTEKTTKRKNTSTDDVQKKKMVKALEVIEAEEEALRRSRRLSARRAEGGEEKENNERNELVAAECIAKKQIISRENVFGEIPRIEVGRVWATRMECSNDGIHRPTVAGIHGNSEGCYSLALSGGYEDDVDLGEAFTYTGEGGRDLKGTKVNPKNLRTAPQSKDQVLSKGNAALWKSSETKTPVRVVRGYKLKSPYAPEEGYRYDGLYQVEKAWTEIGLAGFLVYKFALKHLSGQLPLPVQAYADEGNEEGAEDEAEDVGQPAADSTNEQSVADGQNEVSTEPVDEESVETANHCEFDLISIGSNLES